MKLWVFKKDGELPLINFVNCNITNMKFYFFIFLLFSFNIYAKAESKGYVVKYFNQQSSADLELTNSSTTKLLSYHPNIETTNNIMLAKDGFSFSFPIGLQHASDLDNFKKGKSKSTDFQFTFVTSNLGIDLIYQKYTGFYLNDSEFNTNTTYPTTGESVSTYLQYSSMSLERKTINLYYLSNPDGFSYNASFTQSERQLTSGGSWISLLSVSQFSLSNPNTIIPNSYQTPFGTLKGGKSLGISYMFGGAYTLAFGSPFITLMALAGPIHYSSTFYYSTSNDDKRTRENARALARAAIGYNGESFITSVAVTSDQLTFKTNNTKISPIATTASFAIGYRF